MIIDTVLVIIVLAGVGFATLVCKATGLFGFTPWYSHNRTKHLIMMIKTHQALEDTIITELDDVGFVTRWRVKRYMRRNRIYIE